MSEQFEQDDREVILALIVGYMPGRDGIPKVQDVWLADAIIAAGFRRSPAPQQVSTVIIEAEVSFDDAGERQMPRYMGPFPSVEAANEYMDSLGPKWGTWGAITVSEPPRGSESRG